MLQPTHWIAPAALWMVSSVVLLQTIFFWYRLYTFLFLAAVYLLMAIPYAIRGTLRNAVIRRYRQPRNLRRVDRNVVRRAHVAFLIAAVLVVSGINRALPLYFCIWWITPAAAHEYIDVPMNSPLPPPHWIGPYRVAITGRHPTSIDVDINSMRAVLFFPDDRKPRSPHVDWVNFNREAVTWDVLGLP